MPSRPDLADEPLEGQERNEGEDIGGGEGQGDGRAALFAVAPIAEADGELGAESGQEDRPQAEFNGAEGQKRHDHEHGEDDAHEP